MTPDPDFHHIVSLFTYRYVTRYIYCNVEGSLDYFFISNNTYYLVPPTIHRDVGRSENPGFVTDNLCAKQGNSSILEFKNRGL